MSEELLENGFKNRNKVCHYPLLLLGKFGERGMNHSWMPAGQWRNLL